MTDRIEEIFDQVINEDCPDPLRRFAELVRQDDRARKWVGLTDEEVLIATYELKDVFSVKKIIKLIEAKLKEKNA